MSTIKSHEPVTLAQALENAVLWATKASTPALEQKRDVMAQAIAVASGHPCGKEWRTAGRISDYLEDRGLVDGSDLTVAGRDLIRRLQEWENAERRRAETVGRTLVGGM